MLLRLNLCRQTVLIYLHEKIVACIIYKLAVKVWNNKDFYYFKYYMVSSKDLAESNQHVRMIM